MKAATNDALEKVETERESYDRDFVLKMLKDFNMDTLLGQLQK